MSEIIHLFIVDALSNPQSYCRPPLTPHDMICSNLMLLTFSGPLFSLVSKFFPLFVLSKCARHAHSTCAQDLQQYCEFVLVKLIVAVLVVLFHGVFDLLLPLDVLPEICLSLHIMSVVECAAAREIESNYGLDREFSWRSLPAPC